MKLPQLSAIRSCLWFVIALDLVLVSTAVFLYRPLLKMPGSVKFVVEPVIALLLSAVFVGFASSTTNLSRQNAFRYGATWGTIGGVLLVIHMCLENFGSRTGENGRVTLAFMLATFLTWCAGGYIATSHGVGKTLGLRAGGCSGVVSALIAVTFGLSLIFFHIPESTYVRTWDEFKQSGWTDARAFSIANSFEAAFTHLVVALSVGMIFGVIGAALARDARSVRDNQS